MCRAVCVLGFLALCMGLTHSWDFAVSLGDQLEFYTNGIKTKSINLISQFATALVYDEIHDMILYIDKRSKNDTICGYSLSSEDYKCFIKGNGRDIHSLAFDLATETVFFTDKNERSINYISLKSGYSNNVYGNLFFELDGTNVPTDIAVDSCHRYIYWISIKYYKFWEISRCQLNGSQREVIRTKFFELFNLAIDLQIQKMLYFGLYSDNNVRLVSSGYLTKNDLRGIYSNIMLKYYKGDRTGSLLTVSKDNIYFTKASEYDQNVWQIPKNASFDEPKGIIKLDLSMFGIVANYKLADQIKGIQDCDSLSNLLPTNTVASSNTSERSNISVCENYCLQGNCSFNDEGLPKCSCDTGYSGNRCQISACHEYCSNNATCSLNERNEPTCQCKGDYVGDRCEVSPCLNYCLQGSCSVNDDGLPKCRCNTGYSGDRCEVNMYEKGLKISRYEADISPITPEFDAARRNRTLADLLSIWRKPSSKMYLTVEV